MAIVEVLEENLEDFVVNRTSLQHCRQILCKEQFQESDLQAVDIQVTLEHQATS